MTLLKEPDFGTPERPGPATVSVEVDGLPVTVPEGTSVMRAVGPPSDEVDGPPSSRNDALRAPRIVLDLGSKISLRTSTTIFFQESIIRCRILGILNIRQQ